MRIISIVITFLLISIATYSQKSDIFLLGKFGYNYGEPGDRFGLGAEARVALTDPLKIASAITFMFPHQGITALDVNVNALYSLPIEDTSLQLYPLLGLNMDNNRLSKEGVKRSWTKWGVNLGAGVDYYITKYNFINVDLQYTFVRDYAKIMIGFGHRF